MFNFREDMNFAKYTYCQCFGFINKNQLFAATGNRLAYFPEHFWLSSAI